MIDFLLFGTAGCHLCEEAEAVLAELGLAYACREIMDDEAAQQLYALRIPVLLHIESASQLDWPFDAGRVTAFVRRHKA